MIYSIVILQLFLLCPTEMFPTLYWFSRGCSLLSLDLSTEGRLTEDVICCTVCGALGGKCLLWLYKLTVCCFE